MAFTGSNHPSGGQPHPGSCNDALYKELWHACAGPLVSLPKEGERVYYFPQGHMEQLEASMQQGLEHQMPMFNLPSKILCKVVNVHRKVSEWLNLKLMKYMLKLLCFQSQIKVRLLALILPHLNLRDAQSTPFARHLQLLILVPMEGFQFFEGMQMIVYLHWICPSSPLGRNWLPQISMAMNGISVTFFEVSYLGQPRRHLLTTGWSVFVSSKKLVAGDAFIFLRGESGELRVGVRRHMRQQTNMPSSVISSQSMHLGVLATASHAIATGTLFSVFYKPRTSRSEFIVSVNKYLEARNHKLSVGMRFKMRFEGEEVPERRFSGTIVGVGENLSSGWTDSEWRSFKVQWDEPASIWRPDLVSSWELEPLVATAPSNSQPMHRTNKRSRPSILPSPSPDLNALGMWKAPVEPSSHSHLDSQRGSLYHSPTYPVKTMANSAGFSGNSPLSAVTTTSSMYWPKQVEGVTESLSPAVNRISGDMKQGSGNGYRLFGIQLVDNCNREETSPVGAVSKPGQADCPILSLDAESDQQSEPSNFNRSEIPSVSCDPEKSSLRSPMESHSRQVRSCKKVHMQGIAVGRAVDLTQFECYDDLLRKLEDMFDIEGELSGCNTKKWQVVYTDDEDDMMMVGDDPWHEFCSMVKKIFIYTTEEVKKLSSKTKLPAMEEVKTTSADVDVDASAHMEDQSSIIGSES
ncbi:unnamed protein product [Linum tenue]|uniref:Auxin response factor n=1 Tax=Linum tenue TaxID=586396 RepID=A0AAV0LT07_9ROSI|nr:unnamed protein product [Linum tenue]